MPEFREVSVTDAPALTLLTQYFSDRASSFPSAQGSYRTTLPVAEEFLPPRGVFLLVEEGHSGRYVGCGGVRRIADSPAGAVRYEIKHLWLQPHVRGLGWGRVLLGELESRASAFGAGEVVLDTNASLEAAGALYRKAGYEDIAPYNDNPNATNWYRKALVSQERAEA
ncbi:Ribosomal protein S18 acetylase RimI [Cryobacterium psychrotolerans]|uniref:Ribosomal protein S18 acetylase RimI n=1 Tax=Cryobacterium psychrotolerans TaxID=386301 RepID=A0A1G9EGS1_9MICO|nr:MULTISPECIES: GNAT family N-acetyltransferase [Cryobacterium]TFD40704.1 N-acetyltransferase [Cryobacterium sp. TMT1-2-1]TFD88460.1 N-acetyltransferase [Cryobacterium psychrotolerans]SDK75377.1 Ribosomal protein S18 acetylase RimI [Cryobacterium psychrotolerans]